MYTFTRTGHNRENWRVENLTHCLNLAVFVHSIVLYYTETVDPEIMYLE